MSVGEDQQSNAAPSSTRPSWLSLLWPRLRRRHTFLLGLVAGALLLHLGYSVVRAPSPSDALMAEGSVANPPLVEPPSLKLSARAAVDRSAVAGASAMAAKTEALVETPPAAAPLPRHYMAALVTRAAPPALPYDVPLPDLVRREGQLRPNEFIATILTDAGATLAAQDELFRSLRGKFDFRYAQPGQKYRLEVDHQGRVQSFEFRAKVDEVYRVRRTDDDRLKAQRVDVPLKRDVVEVDGTIKTSLWDAFVNAGESASLAMDMADAFKFDIDFFHDTRKGDRFRLFVEKFTNDEGELVRYGRVYAAEYRGAPRSPVGTKRLFWFRGKKTKGYYDETGKAAQRAFLRSPLKFTRVSSPFGYRRHPILGRRHFHGGVDYAAPRGTPVQAVASGRVTFAARKGPNGNMVRIQHPGGYESLYLHLSRILVRRGQRVGQSTVIGKVGSTGRSTGPHLDFRLKKKGRYINPRQHVAPRTKRVARTDRAQYFKTIKPWQAKLDASSNPG